MALLAKNAKKL